MTSREAFAQLVFGVRFSVAGQLVHSVDLLYENPDGSVAPTNINVHPYSHNLVVGGHAVSLFVEGIRDAPQGEVRGRFYTVTADAPFWIRYTAQMGQVITYDAALGDQGYNIVADATTSRPKIDKGANSVMYDLTADLTALWQGSAIPNKYNFGGIVFADIAWCTHLPLRHPQTGVLLRDPSSGAILRDD